MAMIIALYVQSYSDDGIAFNPQRLGVFLTDYMKAVVRLELIKSGAEDSGDLKEAESRLRARYADLGTIADNNNSRLAALGESLNTLQLEQAHFQRGIEDRVADYEKIDGRISAAENALKERIASSMTDRLWKHESERSAKAFYWTFVPLVVLMLLTPLVVFGCSGYILGYLKDIERDVSTAAAQPIVAASIAISRLLLITVPIGFVIWALKLCIKFAMRSLLLMDDANQRVTMLNTYLFLVEQNAATSQDRGALLEAMFRRAPGHGPETIEPPNITDIMKYGQEVGKIGGN